MLEIACFINSILCYWFDLLAGNHQVHSWRPRLWLLAWQQFENCPGILETGQSEHQRGRSRQGAGQVGQISSEKRFWAGRKFERQNFARSVPLIRFVGMSHKDVAKVCVEKLAAVLSAEEKIQIMHSCLVRKEYFLPPHQTRRPARRTPGSFSNLAGDWLITNLLQHSADKNWYFIHCAQQLIYYVCLEWKSIPVQNLKRADF